MRNLPLSLLLALALAACGNGDHTDSGIDAPSLDAGADALDDAGDGGTDAARVDAGPVCPLDAAALPADAGTGACSATTSAAALLPVGDDGAGGFITPDGRRTTRVGTQITVHGFPMRVVAIPGSHYVVVMDAGLEDEHLVVVDLDTSAIVDDEAFPSDAGHALFLGIALTPDATKLYVSGGGANVVWSFDVDATTGQLTAAHARDHVLGATPPEGYGAGLAILPSGEIAIALMFASAVAVYDPMTGVERGRVAIGGASYPYDVRASADGSTLWVSTLAGSSVVPVDVATLTAGTPIPVPTTPEGLALSPDGTTLAVASSGGDAIALIDVATSSVRGTLPISASTLRGAAPASVAYAADGTLYAVASGENAVDVFTPAMNALGLAAAGRVPTMWYPTDVLPLADGRLLITNGKYVGTGPNTDPGAHSITEILFGSLQVVDAADLVPSQLTSWDAEIETNDARPTTFNGVSCPKGAPYDFPIPQPGGGASTKITHVVLVVRENKTYDDYLGDLLDHAGMPYGNGDPSLVLMPGQMDRLVPNTRELARTFAHADNYYSDAEQSIQGHVWTTNGRTTDFTERTWLTSWGRGYWAPPPQFTAYPLGYSEEGTAFDWLVSHGVDTENDGEIVGSHALPVNSRYPGLVFNLSTTDHARGEYLTRRWLFDCNMPTMTYAIIPDDHTQGLQAGAPTPAAMIADNDDGVGIVAESLSHSQYWPSSLLVVIEDDPQDGGDHVDNHRSLALFVSPWVKRGYVTHVHYNEASIWRTIELILGHDDPLNESWANAAPLYDLFTSTPDYTPYTRLPRVWPMDVNPSGTPGAALAAHWSFARPDDQPGLNRQLWEHFRPGLAAPAVIDSDGEGD